MTKVKQEPKYTILNDNALVVWHAEGVHLTIREWINWQSILSQYPDKVLSYNHLVDFRDATWAITREEIIGALGFSERLFEDEYPDPSSKKQKSAIVCNSSIAIEVWEEYIKLTNVPSNPFHIKVFQDFPEAISWLGHSGEDFEVCLSII